MVHFSAWSIYFLVEEGKEEEVKNIVLCSLSSTFQRIMLHSLYIIMEGQYSPGFHDGLNSSVFSEMIVHFIWTMWLSHVFLFLYESTFASKTNKNNIIQFCLI